MRYLRFLAAALLLSWVGLPAHAQTHQVIYNLTGSSGSNPPAGLIMDSSGSLYATASSNGADGQGTVYKLSRSGSGWTLDVLHNFNWNPQLQISDGANAHAGVIFGSDGSLFGTIGSGGSPASDGTVYELTPSGGRWNESILYNFPVVADGSTPFAGVIFDQSGNLYGTSGSGGRANFGVVYEACPVNGSWQESVLWGFGVSPSGGVLHLLHLVSRI